jgi:hypothetical protein
MRLLLVDLSLVSISFAPPPVLLLGVLVLLFSVLFDPVRVSPFYFTLVFCIFHFATSS